ncbi:phytase [Ephemerocybe angulata]|uniref:Phytase A n=1 Tax=Ephemerocybe angulata TaxID=980116 RepID=A0A8H6ID83_9AGAR|nr:phytase [Tulosesus angulatus]
MGRIYPILSCTIVQTSTPYLQDKSGKSRPLSSITGHFGCQTDSNCASSAPVQVNIIQRHGARFPTSGSTERILAALKKLQSAPVFTDIRLSFVKDYRYPLGVAELVPFGAYQSAESGAIVYDRYRKLVSKGNIPFVRASGSTRVIDSATNWTSGFAEASNNIFEPRLAVVLNESLNDTLEDAMCPRAGDSATQTALWIDAFSDSIAERLNVWAPGANITTSDVPSLMSLCAFESVALEKISSWCSLFTTKEFLRYEYYSDLEKFYGRGYGQELGPVQGVGYINELLARLTGMPVRDNTQTNHTLTASPITFPLDRTIYADFSHDNLMGLFKQPALLDPLQPDPKRTWLSNQLVPFSARLVVERMQCRGAPPRRNAALGDLVRKDTFVRVLVNDAVQPLKFCGADKHGLCTLEAFVQSQSYART